MGHRPCYSMSEEGRGRSVLTNSFETSWKICNLCNLLPRKVCSEKKLNPLETMQITARYEERIKPCTHSLLFLLSWLLLLLCAPFW